MILRRCSTAEFFRSLLSQDSENGALSLDANRQTLAAKPAQTCAVPRAKNAKGIALFALAALANYRRLKTIEAEAKLAIY